MSVSNYFPDIATIFDTTSDNPVSALYNGSIRNALRRILPPDLFFNDEADETMQLESLKSFQEMLPLMTCLEWGKESKNLSIFLLCRSRLNVGKFFYDMITHWLLPGKRLNAALFFSTDFKVLQLDDELYTISEIVLKLDHEWELEAIRSNLSIIEAEIRLGALSVYHGSRILEIKGLSADEKTSLIQETISFLLQRRPQNFDYDIFVEMQHFLVICRDEFKAVREHRHLSRIISILYLFRKVLRQKTESMPCRRHLSLKLLKARLNLPLGVKKILGVLVGMNFLKENEVFEEKHLLKAIQNYIPHVQAVEDSFFVSENREDKIQTIYLEIEKEDGKDFTMQEIKRLRRELPEDLKGHIEQLMRPVFMPRNEEEVMRNIITLSQQLRYIHDIPQVFISFDEQTDVEVSFTVIVVRILQDDDSSIQDLFQNAKTHLKFIPDRVKKVGYLRKKYAKEATVFRVRMPNEEYLRGDHSVDLYKARLTVIKELQHIIGEVRDYNGGMIAKQTELFLSLKNLLGEKAREKELLLENFFHSIYPVEFRSTLPPETLSALFQMLLELVEIGEGKGRFEYRDKIEERRLLLMMSMQEPLLKEKIFSALEKLQMSGSQLVSTQQQILDTSYIGYIYSCDEKEARDLFLKTVQESLSCNI